MVWFFTGHTLYHTNRNRLMEKDVYYIPNGSSEGFYKEKSSKFYAYLEPIKTEQDAQSALYKISKIHPKARHFCYAYRLSPKNQTFRINDDGEPSGTAGKPIYNQIQSAELHEVMIVVVRYFGGTKLGVPGLIRAYKTAAQEACNVIKKVEKFDQLPCEISFDYARMGDLLDAVKFLKFDISEKHFDSSPRIIIQLREAEFSRQIDQLKARLLKRSIEDIRPETEINGIYFPEIE